MSGETGLDYGAVLAVMRLFDQEDPILFDGLRICEAAFLELLNERPESETSNGHRI